MPPIDLGFWPDHLSRQISAEPLNNEQRLAGGWCQNRNATRVERCRGWCCGGGGGGLNADFIKSLYEIHL
jgi:hypothetical protein